MKENLIKWLITLLLTLHCVRSDSFYNLFLENAPFQRTDRSSDQIRRFDVFERVRRSNHRISGENVPMVISKRTEKNSHFGEINDVDPNSLYRDIEGGKRRYSMQIPVRTTREQRTDSRIVIDSDRRMKNGMERIGFHDRRNRLSIKNTSIRLRSTGMQSDVLGNFEVHDGYLKTQMSNSRTPKRMRQIREVGTRYSSNLRRYEAAISEKKSNSRSRFSENRRTQRLDRSEESRRFNRLPETNRIKVSEGSRRYRKSYNGNIIRRSVQPQRRSFEKFYENTLRRSVQPDQSRNFRKFMRNEMRGYIHPKENRYDTFYKSGRTQRVFQLRENRRFHKFYETERTQRSIQLEGSQRFDKLRINNRMRRYVTSDKHRYHRFYRTNRILKNAEREERRFEVSYKKNAHDATEEETVNIANVPNGRDIKGLYLQPRYGRYSLVSRRELKIPSGQVDDLGTKQIRGNFRRDIRLVKNVDVVTRNQKSTRKHRGIIQVPNLEKAQNFQHTHKARNQKERQNVQRNVRTRIVGIKEHQGRVINKKKHELTENFEIKQHENIKEYERTKISAKQNFYRQNEISNIRRIRNSANRKTFPQNELRISKKNIVSSFSQRKGNSNVFHAERLNVRNKADKLTRSFRNRNEHLARTGSRKSYAITPFNTAKTVMSRRTTYDIRKINVPKYVTNTLLPYSDSNGRIRNSRIAVRNSRFRNSNKLSSIIRLMNHPKTDTKKLEIFQGISRINRKSPSRGLPRKAGRTNFRIDTSRDLSKVSRNGMPDRREVRQLTRQHGNIISKTNSGVRSETGIRNVRSIDFRHMTSDTDHGVKIVSNSISSVRNSLRVSNSRNRQERNIKKLEVKRTNSIATFRTTTANNTVYRSKQYATSLKWMSREAGVPHDKTQSQSWTSLLKSTLTSNKDSSLWEYLSSKRSGLMSFTLNVMLGLAVILASSDDLNKGFMARQKVKIFGSFFGQISIQ